MLRISLPTMWLYFLDSQQENINQYESVDFEGKGCACYHTIWAFGFLSSFSSLCKMLRPMVGSLYFNKLKGGFRISFLHFSYTQFKDFMLKNDLIKLNFTSFLFAFQISPHHQLYQDTQLPVLPTTRVWTMRMEIQSLWSAVYLATGLSPLTLRSMIYISFLKCRSKFPISPSPHGFPCLVPLSKDRSGL